MAVPFAPESKDVVEIDGLFDQSGLQPWAIQWLDGADFIFGVARSDGHHFLICGRELMQKISSGTESEGDRAIAYVGLDQETDDLEKLVAAVRHIKGRDDYQPFKAERGSKSP